MVGAQTPGTKTQYSPWLTPYLFIWPHTALSRQLQALHMESSKSIFLLTCSLSPFSLGETNKGCPDPAANVLLLDASAKETGCCSSFCFLFFYQVSGYPVVDFL